MRTLNVLHLASFAGNTGDGAMHDGAYRTRQADMPFEFAYDRVEMREFVHWGRRGFDADFIAQANRSDVLLLGGNSIFQMWRDNTASGTYFDFAPDYLLQITKPIVFYGIGCDATRGISSVAMERFRAFLDAMISSDRVLFSLRNDGSRTLVAEGAGEQYAAAMPVIPDGGLFAEPHASPRRPSPYIVVNVAGDMPEVRYGEDGLTQFSRHVAGQIDDLLSRHADLRVLFVPHVYSDLAVIADCLAALDDRNRRTRVEVAPYLVDAGSWADVFALYRGAAAVLAMRFHASLVPLGIGVPTVGLSTHHKVSGMFAGLGLGDRCIDVDGTHVGQGVDKAFRLLDADLETAHGARAVERQAAARNRERQNLAAFHRDMTAWLQRRL